MKTCRNFVAFIIFLLISAIVDAQVAFPLKISDNKRYFVDQHDRPFLLHGDTPWSLTVGCSKEDVILYLNHRAKQGINTLIVNLIEYKYGPYAPANTDKIQPFTAPGKFDCPNETYFAHCDFVMEQTAKRGMQILLTPVYLGYKGGDEGWCEEVKKATEEQMRSFGRYCGRRYGEYNNLMWVMGGDRSPEGVETKVEALIQGILEKDSRHLVTAHASGGTSSLDEYDRSWLTCNATYEYDNIPRQCKIDYEKASGRFPIFLFETQYEGWVPWKKYTTPPQQVRRQAWWAVLSGASGQCYGHEDIFPFDGRPRDGRIRWKEELEAPGFMSLIHLRSLLLARQWWKLVPDFEHKTVINGYGDINTNSYMTTARTSDGATVIGYMPDRRSISVDMTRISGNRAVAWWYNPVDGNVAVIDTFPTSGTRQFEPPSNTEWVIVMDDASKNVPLAGGN